MLWKVVSAFLVFTSVAHAGFEIEIDPLAYLAKGYSGHLIYDTEAGVSIDIGAYGMEMPEFVETNEGFRSSFTGYGVKLNYHGKSVDGAFAGVGYGVSRLKAELKETGDEQEADMQSVGVQFGYRFGREGFYVTPWIGFDKVLNSKKLDFGAKTYDLPEYNIFPTVHLGYRF